MTENKKGKAFLIDKINKIKLYEILYGNNKPLYKVYKGKQLLGKWKSNQDLHNMDIYEIADSTDYATFLDYAIENTDENILIDVFGLPEEGMLALGKGNKEVRLHTPEEKKADIEKKEPVRTYNGYYSYGGSNYSYETKETTGLADNLKNSDTLVIHCQDASTEMLGQIYEGKGWDVLRDGSIAESELHDLLKCHDRIVMLGHGTSGGLINVQRNKGGKRWTVIDDRYAQDLKDKKLFVIWCNADGFFDKVGIGDGQFITGNMPSETWECRAAGCGDISTQEMLDNITYWSKLCADAAERCLQGNAKEGVEYIRRNYIEHYGDHPVTRYNAIRTKVHGTSMQQNEQEVDNIYKQVGKEVPQVKSTTYNYYNRDDNNKFNLFGKDDEKQFVSGNDNIVDADFTDID